MTVVKVCECVVSFYFNNMLGVSGGKYKDIRLGPASSRVDKKPAVADGQMARYYWPGHGGHIARICYPRPLLICYFTASWFVASHHFFLAICPPSHKSFCDLHRKSAIDWNSQPQAKMKIFSPAMTVRHNGRKYFQKCHVHCSRYCCSKRLQDCFYLQFVRQVYIAFN